MRSLFVFAVVLSASAVFSAPLAAKNENPEDEPVDPFADVWKKHFPAVKFQPLTPPVDFPFPALPDPFLTGEKDGSGALQPRFPFWPKGFGSDFFKDINKKFDPKDFKNDTVENVREVDGHIIHEKESSFTNGDENSRVAFRSKTVIIRPKNNVNVDQVDKKVGTDVETVATYKPNTAESQPKVRNVQSRSPNPKTSNPDDEVEMFHVSKNRDQDEDLSI